jgi:hypothetical protein
MQMPTIRVDDEVFGWLKSQAEPFVDTPNMVLRRVSGLESVGIAEDVDSNRARMGELLDRREYDGPILSVLARRGGSAPAREVVSEVGEIVRERLTEKDRTENRSGVIRWRNRVMWRRFVLVQAGLLKSDSPRGLWELTEAGRNAAKEANGTDTR